MRIEPTAILTITDVRVSGDTQQATVFYTVLGADEDREGTAMALASAKGLIRSEVGKQLGMRHVPTLDFIADALPETARHIDDLLERVRESDAAAAQSVNAGAFAGEPDPYKKPREPGDADELERLHGLPTLASQNHAFDSETPTGGNYNTGGKPAPPRDAREDIGDLLDAFTF